MRQAARAKGGGVAGQVNLHASQALGKADLRQRISWQTVSGGRVQCGCDNFEHLLIKDAGVRQHKAAGENAFIII